VRSDPDGPDRERVSGRKVVPCPLDGYPLRSVSRGVQRESDPPTGATYVHVNGYQHGGLLAEMAMQRTPIYDGLAATYFGQDQSSEFVEPTHDSERSTPCD
jgi:hypothetical protein